MGVGTEGVTDRPFLCKELTKNCQERKENRSLGSQEEVVVESVGGEEEVRSRRGSTEYPRVLGGGCVLSWVGRPTAHVTFGSRLC